jgi:hypothetical protein
MTDYAFQMVCPFCNEMRGVNCSREQAKTGEPIEIYAISCDHKWTLTPEDSNRLRENSDVLR